MRRRTFILGAVGAAGVAAVGGGAAWLHSPPFGRSPSVARLKRLTSSPNWRGGAFRNLEPFGAPPPDKREGRLRIWWKFLFGDKSAQFPPRPLPVADGVAEALAAAAPRDAAVWLGHSTVFLRLGGVRILVDPVFGAYASPVPFINRAFPYTRPFSAEDIPDVDVLALTHDHWDHLDYPTLVALRPKVRTVVCPLGVGEYLEQWGYDPGIIREGDWWETFDLGGVEATLTPTRHFSGRLSRMNQTLWCGFAFAGGGGAGATRRVYVSGDGGWGRHVAEIARRVGPVDWAFLENGQYNERWPSVHMMPFETALTARTLRARAVVPVHNAKFALSVHAWDEPLRALSAESADAPYCLVTPRPGEVLDLNDPHPLPRWWESVARAW